LVPGTPHGGGPAVGRAAERRSRTHSTVRGARWETDQVRGTTPELNDELRRAGYYPELVADVMDVALAGEPVTAFLVHHETTFDEEAVRRHVTVLAITATRLVVAHVDDHGPDRENPATTAAATTEAVAVRLIRSVMLTHVVEDPQRHRIGGPRSEVSLGIGWGAVSHVDLEPASCGDPACEADHGLTGSIAPNDVMVRVSAQAEGLDAVRSATAFAVALSAATAGTR